MGDWIGLGFIVLLVVGAVVGLSYLSRPRKPLTEEEYEERVAQAKGTTRAAALAGMNALNKMINPKAVEAVEKQRDFQAGYYNDQEKAGEPDEPGRKKEELNPTGQEERDA
jgi:hypothetical protein